MNAEEFERAYGGADRKEWVNGLPSVATGHYGCINAHVASGGTSRKADARFIVPLTWAEHQDLHQHGQRTFEAKHGIVLLDEAAKVEAAWQAYCQTPRLPF